MNVAVIPARGGSKRIPGKNIRLFAGKPMIEYSIACAFESGVFDRIIVSTDDDTIAQVAQDAGAEVPFRRPATLSDDYTGTTEVIAHAIETLGLEARASKVCCIYATAPFIRASDVRSGLHLLENGAWQYVFSATTFAAPIFRSFRETESGGVEMFFPDRYNMRSQDLPEALHDAGQFYWGHPDAWMSHANIFGSMSAVVHLPRWRVQDIDTEADWIRAESMANYLAANQL